jgi:hypothetical protein
MERWNEPEEYKVWYAECDSKCGWDDEENHGSEEECASECPECGASTTITQDWDNR